jgi:WD40 repeat protein
MFCDVVLIADANEHNYSTTALGVLLATKLRLRAKRHYTRIVSAHHDGAIRVWNIGMKDIQQTLSSSSSGVIALLELENGNIVTGSMAGEICIWNIRAQKCVLRIKEAHSRLIAGLLEVDGMLISASHDEQIHVWQISKENKRVTCKKCRTLRGHDCMIISIASIGHGKIISAGYLGNGDNVMVWNIRTGECLKKMKTSDSVISANKIADGKIVMCQDPDIVSIHDQKTLENTKTHLKVASRPYASVQLPDGTIAIGLGNNCVCIWDIESNKIVKSFSPLVGIITKIQVLDEEKLVICSNVEGFVIWNHKTDCVVQKFPLEGKAVHNFILI